MQVLYSTYAVAPCNCTTALISMPLPHAMQHFKQPCATVQWHSCFCCSRLQLLRCTQCRSFMQPLHRTYAYAIAPCNRCVALKVLPLRNYTHVDAVAHATPQWHSCIAACNCSTTPSAAASCNCSAAPLPMLLPHATACSKLLPT